MTEEHEKLLLKDLSARLPYGVKLRISSWDDVNMEYVDKADTLYSISSDNHVRTSSEDQDFYIDEIKPYLFPKSSMNEEQRNEYNRLRGVSSIPTLLYYCDNLSEIVEEIDLRRTVASINYLYENHFDCNGLIPLGLATDATGLGIY